MKKFIGVTAAILSVMMLLASCTIGDGDAYPTPSPAPTPDPELVKNTINAEIVLENGDEILLELYPDLAPETVENFVELAEDGFYDGTIFHRVIEDFMIQGGGYDENLKAKKADTINGEFAANGFENTLAHTRGVISMARAQNMNSATSQFFIVQQDSTFLDGQYAAFGRVTEGMEVVDEIASERTGSVASAGMEDVPVDPIVIETITISSGSSKNSSKNDDEDILPAKSSPKPTKKPSLMDDDEEETSKATTKPQKSIEDEDGDEEDSAGDIARGFFEDYS